MNSENDRRKLSQALDLLTVLQFSQQLAGELALDRLLAKMMQIFMEISGAEKGYLILNKNGQWVIEASEVIISDRVEVLQSIPIATLKANSNTTMLSNAIANYVIDTRNVLVLDNAVAEGDFIGDSYVLQEQSKSILCIPLINQNKLVAILYLENTLVTKAFTSEQLEILNLLSPQAAISIENAKIFTQLQESEKKWIQIIEAVPFGVSAHTEDGKVFYINQTGQRLLGQDIKAESTLQELIESCQVYITGTDQLYPLEELPVWRALKGEQTIAEDLEVHRKGAIIPFEMQAMPVFDERGNIIYAVNAFQDITERKRAEAALQESEFRYRGIVEDQTELVSRFLPDGTLIFVNDAYCRYFGIKKEEIIGNHYAPVVFEEDLEYVQEMVQTITKENPVVIIENRVVVGKEVRWTQWINRALFDRQNQLLELQSVGRDISDLKEVEQALRESEQRYRQIVETADEGIWVIDLEGNTTFVNPKMAEMLGYSIEEMLEMPIFYFSNEEGQTIAKNNLQLRRQGVAGKLDFKFQRKDGSELWAIIASSPILDEFGKSTGVLGMVTDITQRKQTENALHRYERIVSTTNDAIALLDRSYKYQIVNQTYKNWRKKSESEIIGHSVSEILGTEVFEQIVKHFLDRCLDGETIHYQAWFDYELAKRRFLSVNYVPYVEPDHKISGVVVSLRDLTELKKAEEELQRSEERYRQIVETAEEGIWVIDLEGKTLFANPKMAQMLGCTVEELLGLPMFAFMDEEGIAISRKNLERRSMGIQEKHDFKFLSKDGSELWTIISTTPIFNESGEPTGALGMLTDITDRKQFEEALKQAKQAAEAANHTKSTFLANMSHELRTPLNAVLGFSQLLKNSADLSAEHKKNLDTITRSGEHLLTLINQVLDLSKIEAGRTTLNKTDFDLDLFLDDLQDLFQLKANNKGLQLLFYHSSDVPQYVCADEVKLRQVLINLLSNAMKFTKEGRVTVRVSMTNDRELMTNDEKEISLHFEVADTGPGIAADELDSVFEAFIQTKTGQQFQEGTGLGLTICRKFVELMGGEITLSSQLGFGTTFRFDIIAQRVEPSQIETEKVTRRPIALAPNQPSYRLLIVDDSLDNRQVLLSLLSPFGFELREANNGQEAIEIWETWQPNLIFMDMRMPVMNGYEATKHIRSVTKNQSIVIIAVSASSLEEERSIVIAAGCNDFIRKPYKEADIFGALQKYIQVRFIYDEINKTTTKEREQENLIPAALKKLPTNLVTDFVEALIALDVELIEDFITQIRQFNEPLANAITVFTNNFQYEQLLQLIKSEEVENE